MEQFILQDLPEDKRAAHLEALAEGIEERDYSVFLTQDELAIKKSEFTTLAIQEAKLNDTKADFLASIKLELKPIQIEKQAKLNEIKNGTIQENGACYKVVDDATRMVGFYNSRGHMVEQRPMNQADGQKTIKMAVNKSKSWKTKNLI